MRRLSSMVERRSAIEVRVALTCRVLHAGFDSRLDPLSCRPPWHVLGRWPCMFLDALPQPLPHLAIDAHERTANIFPGAWLGHECECRLSPLAFDTEKLELALGDW